MPQKVTSFWTQLNEFYALAQSGDKDVLGNLMDEAARACDTGDEKLDTARLDLLEKMAATVGLEFTRPPRVYTPPPPRPMPVGRARKLPQISPEGRPGVSLVTCCRNRTENLVRALDSWLACSQINEIIIVDWTSDHPVRQALQAGGITDARIRVIRVEDEPRWILTKAFNVGFRVASCERVLKADADIVLDPAFFEQNHLEPGHFIAGNWRAAASDQVYVNGFFYLFKRDLAAISGFNEHITTYGWDDDDIYDRLARHGAQRRDVDITTLHHLPHSDADRIGFTKSVGQTGLSAWDEVHHDTMHQIRANRLLTHIMPYWDAAKTALPFRILETGPDLDAGDMVLRRMGPVPHPVPAHIRADVDYYATLEMASWRLGLGVFGLDRGPLKTLLQKPFSELDEGAVKAALTPASTLTPALIRPRSRLFVDAQHGLGNRLRAIGSGAVLAAKSDREMVVVWQPDDHCDCRFGDLFDYDGAVIDESFIGRAADQGARVYNYMEIEPGAEKGAEIALDGGGDIYARAAYVLNNPLSSWAEENRFLRALRPVDAVRTLLDTVRSPNDVSVHVRMAGGKDYEHLSYESTNNWTEEGHREIGYWREKSHFSRFIKRLETLNDEARAGRIFLAADAPETYREFAALFGDRLAMLERGVYDRSVAQLRYALADALLLGRSPLLLGSTWSSFSELAMRLAPQDMAVELSGTDF